MILNHLLSSCAFPLYWVYKDNLIFFCGLLSLVSSFLTYTQFQIPASPLHAKISSASSAAADHVCYYSLSPQPKQRTQQEGQTNTSAISCF